MGQLGGVGGRTDPTGMLPAAARCLRGGAAACSGVRAAAAPLRGLAGRARVAARQAEQWVSPPPRHELWRPAPFLGAYYTLREGEPAAMRNRAKLKQKKEPTRGRFIVDVLDRLERERLEAKEPWRRGKFNPGDVLQVEHVANAGDAAGDMVVGVMLGMHRRGLGSGFRLLCKVDDTPVEYHFQLYSPLVRSITLRQKSTWRDMRRKLYALRETALKLNLPKPLVPGREGDGGGAKKKKRR